MQHRAAKRIGLRRAGTALTLSVLAVPASSGTASAASNSATLPAGSSKHHATAYERELARAGVVKYDDLPSWTVTTMPDANDLLGPAVGCPGEKTVRHVAGNTTFAEKGSRSITSASTVVDSVQDAESELRWLKSGAGLKCLRDSSSGAVISGGLGGGLPGDFSESVSVQRIHVEVPGADEVAAFRIATSMTFGGVTVKSVGYLIDTRVGRTELSIYTAAEHTPSLRKAERLLRTVVERVDEL